MTSVGENPTYFRTFATDRKQVDFGRENSLFPLILIQVKSAAKRTVFGLKDKREKAFLPFKTQLFHIQVVRYAAKYCKISTIRRRVSLDMSRTTASDFYASVNLGLCFCRSETEPPHLQRTLLGPILPQRVIIVRKYGLNKVYYLMKSPERRSRITK